MGVWQASATPRRGALAGIVPKGSASKVRQGCTLGRLLFSLALRPLLRRLCEHLGPHRRPVACLDDIYILSTDSSTMADALSFFQVPENSYITLNQSKCRQASFDKVREEGFEILGTVVGSRDAALHSIDLPRGALHRERKGQW